MKKFKLVHTFGSVIAEGSKEQVEFAYKAFQSYGISEHKYDIVEVEENRYGVSEECEERVWGEVFDIEMDGLLADCVVGSGYKGLDQYTLAELMDLAGQCEDRLTEESKAIVNAYFTNKAIQQEVL